MRKITVDLKSQVRFARSIIEALFFDIAAGRPLVLRKSLARDLETILSRMDNEGLSFCTITLPSLSKAMFQSFRTGHLVVPSGFRRAKGTSLPALLQGLMKEIYTVDGYLLPQASPASISEVLQVCGLGYKLCVPQSAQREQAVIDAFLQTESDLCELEESFPAGSLTLELAKSMIEEVFHWKRPDGSLVFDPKEVIPRHGPGAVATGERGHRKWEFRRKYTDIHEFYPYYEYFTPSRKGLLDRIAWYRGLKTEIRGVAKVSLVPKDSRGPRLISAEPLEYQYIQQGLWREMLKLFETHPFTRQHVNFRDQGPNRELATAGSRTEKCWVSWATLDMKEASDRVSSRLIYEMFERVPTVRRALFAARSHSTKLPSGEIVDLHKFAPMGSAICFPIESIVHYVLAIAIIVRNTALSRSEARRCVYVYGDDLIISPEYAELVMEQFPRFGLKFNPDKCFIHGPFRESCGIEAFKGVDVSPARWRKPWSKRLDAVTAQAQSQFATLLYSRGYCTAAEVVWKELERRLVKLPTVPLSMDVGYLCRRTRLQHIHSPHRFRKNLRLQKLEHNAYVIGVKSHDLGRCGWEMLHEHLLTGSVASTEVSVYSSLKRRWIGLLG